MTKLLCAICGTYTARVYHVDDPYNDWFVKCDTCGNSMPPTDAMVHSEAEAISAWQGAYAFRRIAELETQLTRLHAEQQAEQDKVSVST